MFRRYAEHLVQKRKRKIFTAQGFVMARLLPIHFIPVVVITVVFAAIAYTVAETVSPADSAVGLGLVIIFIVIGSGIASIVSYILTVRYFRPIAERAYKTRKLSVDSVDIPLRFGQEELSDILNNTIDYLVSVVQNRERKIEELNRQIEDSKRLSSLGELTAGVAHEINNPLGGIIVYSNLLREDTPANDPNYPNIEKIIRESERCKNIVKKLLTIARQSQPKFEQVDIHTIITEALSNLRSEDIFRNIRVIEAFGENVPTVKADISQIQEVFENIIRNAAEIMEDSGELKIVTGADSENGNRGMVSVRFKDTGPGISEEHLDNIFDPFFTTKLKGHGTGLGLALSHGIIERHRGSLTAKNQSGGGAIFTVLLPVFTNAEK